MYKDKKILAVITARGGSKGIPKKNIKMLGGKPLIVWTIEAAKNAKYLTDFILSTDDAEIAEVARGFGCPIPFVRPEELASDSAKSIPVVQHALTWMKENQNKEYDYLMILQPTSPFRTSDDIDQAIQKIVDTNSDSVMGMVKLVDFSIPKLKRLEDSDVIKPWLEEEGKESKSRHELADVYKRNCAIYLTRTDLIMAGDLFGTISRAFVMPPERSIDTNTSFDFIVAEAVVSANKPS